MTRALSIAGFVGFLWRRYRLLVLALVLALGAFGYFAGGLALRALYFNDPRHQQQTLEPWMTPRYVSQSWRIPPPVLNRILELERKHVSRDRPPTLGEIAANLELTLPEIETLLQAELARRAQNRHGGGRPPREGGDGD